MEPSQKAIDYLLANPDTANFFDEKFGQGMAAKVIASQKKEEETKPLSAADVVSGFARNIVPSTGKLISELAHAVTSPVETAKTAYLTAEGAVRNILPKQVVEFADKFNMNPELSKQAVQMADAVGGIYKERYGTLDGFKKALATDPASVMADMATLLTGGAGAARAAAAIPSKVAPALEATASVAQKAASYVDPLSLAAKSISGAAGIIPKAATAALGSTSGVGSEAVSQAFRAGKEGGQVGQSFIENLRGKADMQDVLDVAKSNLEAIRKQRSDVYKANIENIKNDATVLSFKGIDDAVNQAFNAFTFKGKPKNDLAIQKLNEVKEKITDWKALDPAEYHTPEGLDALKQSIGQILEDLKPRTPSDTAVKGVYNAIKNEINKQAPTYAKTMKAYSDSTDLIREIERSLSLGDKASADTAMRKLQSVMRNNVNTNYGQRMALMKELEQAGGREMMPALAGQALSDVAPRGIQRATAPLGAIGLASTGGIPAAVLGAMLSSPRVVGEASYLAGKAAALPGQSMRGLLDLEARLPSEFQISPRQLPELPTLDASTLNLLYQLRQREEEKQ